MRNMNAKQKRVYKVWDKAVDCHIRWMVKVGWYKSQGASPYYLPKCKPFDLR